KEKARNLFPNISLDNLSKLRLFYLDKTTHPDILKFIALAVAYSSREELIPNQEQELVSYQQGGNQSLAEIARQFALPANQLQKYNTWLKTDRIPTDRTYDVIVPIPSASPTRDVQILTSPSGDYVYQTAQESQTHIVLKGETLYGISRQYDVAVGDLKKWNQLQDQDVLKIGQKLLVSYQTDDLEELEETLEEGLPKAEVDFTYQEHRVIKGDNLYRISRNYGASLQELRSWNNLRSDFLKVGQVLRVKKIPRGASGGASNTEKDSPMGTVGSPTGGSNAGNNPKKDKEANRPSGSARSLKTKTVPREVQLGDLKLRLNRGLRKKIQKDVNLLTRSETYFFRNLKRIDKYMPLVADVLDSLGLPTDFKYLPIQESVLLGDVVSRSQAVGYWQFKAASAREVGLLINSQVDERMNIYAATLGACKYLNRNNLYYQNWLISLLSYNMGFTGAKNYIKQNYPKVDLKRVKTMDLDEKTHWYIRKFIAHKIVYEQELGWYPEQPVLMEYRDGKRKSLGQIAEAVDCDPEALRPHNLWLKKTKVPSDKDYVVIVPYMTR
ncbi:MAG: LysM peptidoglycan-binding domain-containing protein, partial [Bacteroidota bacterium]